jgi:hypothetical protein
VCQRTLPRQSRMTSAQGGVTRNVHLISRFTSTSLISHADKRESTAGGWTGI